MIQIQIYSIEAKPMASKGAFNQKFKNGNLLLCFRSENKKSRNKFRDLIDALKIVDNRMSVTVFLFDLSLRKKNY